MSVSYEDNNNKEFINSLAVEGRKKPTATIMFTQTVTVYEIIKFNLSKWS